jgi:hypothetical protein
MKMKREDVPYTGNFEISSQLRRLEMRRDVVIDELYET